MLAKKFHLRGGALRQKPTYRSRYFICKEWSNGLPFSRFGVVVGRSVEKLATRRNRIKRAVFEHIRLGKIHLRPGKDVLTIALPPAAGLKNEEIQKELDKFLNSQ